MTLPSDSMDSSTTWFGAIDPGIPFADLLQTVATPIGAPCQRCGISIDVEDAGMAVTQRTRVGHFKPTSRQVVWHAGCLSGGAEPAPPAGAAVASPHGRKRQRRMTGMADEGLLQQLLENDAWAKSAIERGVANDLTLLRLIERLLVLIAEMAPQVYDLQDESAAKFHAIADELARKRDIA